MGAERRRARREKNGSLNGLPGHQAKSAGSRRNPRKHAGARKEKGQPSVVGLWLLVVGWQRTPNSVYQRVRSGPNCCGFTRVGSICRVIITDDEAVFCLNWVAVSASNRLSFFPGSIPHFGIESATVCRASW